MTAGGLKKIRVRQRENRSEKVTGPEWRQKKAKERKEKKIKWWLAEWNKTGRVAAAIVEFRCNSFPPKRATPPNTRGKEGFKLNDK